MANQSYVDASPAVPFLINLISASRKKEMNDAANNQDMAAAQADPGFWQKLAMGADAYKDMPAVQDYIYKQQAAPKLADLEGMLRGPEFQGAEGLQELRDRPEFWAGQTDYSNPYLAQAQNAIPRKAETQLQAGEGLRQMYEKGAINPELYAQIAVNDSLNVTGKDGKTNPLIDQMMKLGTHRNTEEGISNLQATYNDMGKAGFGANDKANALMAVLRRGVNPEIPMKLAGIEAKPLHYFDNGTGTPGVTVPSAYDPNINKTGAIGGNKVEMPRNVNVTVPVYNKTYEETSAKLNAQHVDDLRKAANASRQKLNSYDAMENLLTGVDTGAFSVTGMQLAAAGDALGLKVDPNLGNKQAAYSLGSQMVLQARTAGGENMMPGAMSDGDRKFLTAIPPSMGQTPEGRKQLLTVNRAIEGRNLQVHSMQEKYIQKYGKIDDGWYRQIDTWANNNPLFPKKGK